MPLEPMSAQVCIIQAFVPMGSGASAGRKTIATASPRAAANRTTRLALRRTGRDAHLGAERATFRGRATAAPQPANRHAALPTASRVARSNSGSPAAMVPAVASKTSKKTARRWRPSTMTCFHKRGVRGVAVPPTCPKRRSSAVRTGNLSRLKSAGQLTYLTDPG
jgi:hypothetical protein